MSYQKWPRERLFRYYTLTLTLLYYGQEYEALDWCTDELLDKWEGVTID
jgi:hypothetical protein